jgi:hypothetical protein
MPGVVNGDLTFDEHVHTILMVFTYPIFYCSYTSASSLITSSQILSRSVFIVHLLQMSTTVTNIFLCISSFKIHDSAPYVVRLYEYNRGTGFVSFLFPPRWGYVKNIDYNPLSKREKSGDVQF